MKIIIVLFIGGLLIFSGYYLRRVINPSAINTITNPTNSNTCGPQGCNNNTMVHSIAIIDDKSFLLEMIPHHQEAVDSSQLLVSSTTDAELKQFLTEVITVQTLEINQMKTWLKDWYGLEYSADSNYLPMMGDLSTFEGRNLEKVYVEGMIRHHQGAIEMAQKVLMLNPRPEIAQMAEEIVTVQQSEVETLQKWLDTKYQGIKAKDTMNHMMDIN